MTAIVDYTPYWTTVAQVVPVFGIALVLEVRSAARNWTSLGKVQRRIESTVHVTNAFVLIAIFPVALVALSGANQPGNISRAVVAVGLGVSLVLLVWLPIWATAGRANIDLVFLVQRTVPWSALSRLRRQLRRSLAEAEAVANETIELISLARTGYEQARADLASKGRFISTASEWMSGFAGEDDLDPEFERLVGRQALLQAVKEYDLKPTVPKARALRRMRVRSSLRLLAKARVQRARVLCIREDLLTSLDSLQRGRLGSKELRVVEASIQRASDAMLAPWPIAEVKSSIDE